MEWLAADVGGRVRQRPESEPVCHLDGGSRFASAVYPPQRAPQFHIRPLGSTHDAALRGRRRFAGVAIQPSAAEQCVGWSTGGDVAAPHRRDRIERIDRWVQLGCADHDARARRCSCHDRTTRKPSAL